MHLTDLMHTSTMYGFRINVYVTIFSLVPRNQKQTMHLAEGYLPLAPIADTKCTTLNTLCNEFLISGKRKQQQSRILSRNILHPLESFSVRFHKSSAEWSAPCLLNDLTTSSYSFHSITPHI